MEIIVDLIYGRRWHLIRGSTSLTSSYDGQQLSIVIPVEMVAHQNKTEKKPKPKSRNLIPAQPKGVNVWFMTAWEGAKQKAKLSRPQNEIGSQPTKKRKKNNLIYI